MKTLIAQLNPTVGDLAGNSAKIISTLGRARAQGVDLVLFPELVITGYPPSDFLFQEAFIDAAEQKVGEILSETVGMLVFVGLPRRNHAKGGKSLYNSCAVLGDGKLLGFYDKGLLPTYDVFDERRYFEPGSCVRTWQWKGKTIGVTICEDIWGHAGLPGMNYPRDPVAELLPLKPDLVVNLSASPYHFEKREIRFQVCAKAAETLKCPLLFCSQVGGNDQLVFDGCSLVVDGKGNLLQMARGFVEEELLIDLEEVGAAQEAPSFDSLRDLYKALCLGVRDYFHKSGFQKACLGLSGGIDSALVAVIAAEALGPENVLGVAMPSRYSSPGSLSDAKALAENLGIGFTEISIEEPFSAYLSVLEPHFEGKGPNIAEENLQARVRGMLLMALSNKLGYIVLSTGNKSELALGYCTLYGDMCGGLGVISDVTKGRVYELARFLNREREVIPRSSIEKPPSAELRVGQKDTDSLPDYAIVDAVLEGYVEEYLSPEEIAKAHSLPLSLVTDLVTRIHRAEYKRRQSPPGIRVTKKAFSLGRIYPIVQKWV